MILHSWATSIRPEILKGYNLLMMTLHSIYEGYKARSEQLRNPVSYRHGTRRLPDFGLMTAVSLQGARISIWVTSTRCATTMVGAGLN